MSILNEYEIKARYVPAVLTAIPFIILSSFIKEDVWLKMFSNANWFLITENISLSLIFTYLIINFQRFIGKYWFEKKLFQDEFGFPTTRYLLWSDTTFSESFKQNLHSIIKQEFQIELLDKNKESENSKDAKKIIKDVVRMIRYRVGKGKLVLHYNTEYGFMRNLIAGSPWAILGSIITMIIFISKTNYVGIVVSSLFTLLFFTILIFHKKILTNLANSYAKNLLIEFVELNKLDK